MTFWHYVFAVVYPVLVITVMVAVWFYARAIAFGRYKNIVLDNEMLAFFRGNRYVDVIYAMSKRFADDTRILNELNNQKVSHAARAFVVTRIALLVMALLLLLLVLIKLQ
jgi:hypothetical protein